MMGNSGGGMMGNMGGGSMMGNMGSGGNMGVSPQILQQLGIEGPVTNTVFVSNVSASEKITSNILLFLKE